MDENARVIELLTEISEKLGGSSVGNLAKQAEAAAKGLEGEAKQRKINEVMVKQATEALAIFDKAVKRGRKSILDLGPTLDRFEESLDEMTDVAKKSELEQKRNALASQYLTAQYKKSAADISVAVGKVLVGGIAKTTGSLVRSLQTNASGATVAGEVLTNAIDMAQSGFSTVAKGGQALGTTLAMSTTPKVSKLGIATAVASTALEGITSTLSDLAKFGIQVMVKEVEKTVKAFNEITAAGALFTGGMEGVREAAAESGLTVEQFSNVIKTNSATLAETGLTVTAAATRMGQVGKIIKSSGIEEGLMKLGFGFEEQSGLIAEVMANMRRSNTLSTATNPQVAAAVEKYATNLRIIADITGEDAKARQQAAKDQATAYAFNRKIAEVAAKTGQQDLLEQVTNYLAILGPENSKIYMQKVVSSIDGISSGITTDAMANLSGFGDALNESVQSIYSGNFQMRSAATSLTNFSRNFANTSNETFNAISSGAILGVSSLDGMANQASQLLSFTQKMLDPAKAIEDAEKRKNATDTVTEDLINAEKNAQRLRIEQEMILTGQLAEFASVVDGILKNLRETVEKYMNQFKEKSIWDAVTHIATTAGIGAAGFALAGGIRGGIIGSAAPGPGTLAGASAGAITGGIYGGISGLALGAYEVSQGNYADGGIVHQPEVALIGEGGNSEAVVPLPDNRSIPVTLTNNQTNSSPVDTKEIVSAINQQTGMLTRILVSMEKNNQLTSGILQTSY